jgi:hypothetical protein
MALGSTQRLTEMSTRNLPGGKRRPLSVSRLSRKCGSVDVSQGYGPPRPVTGIAFSFVPHVKPLLLTASRNRPKSRTSMKQISSWLSMTTVRAVRSEVQESMPGKGRILFCSPQHAYRLWSPPSFLSYRYRDLSPTIKQPAHPIQYLRIHGALPLFWRRSSGFDAWLSRGTTLPVPGAGWHSGNALDSCSDGARFGSPPETSIFIGFHDFVQSLWTNSVRISAGKP